jgi:CheY-like chemotaxis protein/signal transduction histidine kinase
MKRNLNRRLLFYIIATLLITSGATIAFIGFASRKASLNHTRVTSTALAGQYGNYTRAELEIYLDASRTLAQVFSQFESIPEASRRQVYMDMLKHVLRDNVDFLSVWTIWEPYTIDRLDGKNIMAPGSTRIGNFSPTFYRQGNTIKLEVSAPDAALFEGDYFTLPKVRLRETILNPYKYSFTGRPEDAILQTSLITPIIRDGKFLGVVGVDASLDQLQQKFRGIRPMGDGMVFLISNNGVFVAHPNKKFVGAPIDSVFGDLVSIELLDQKIAKGEAFQGSYFCKLNRQEYELSIVPLSIGQTGTPWALGIAIPKDTVLREAKLTFWKTIGAGILSIIFMSLVVIYISRKITNPLKQTTQHLEELARGALPDVEHVIVKTKDELGQMSKALQRLARALKTNTDFALAIGEGNLEVPYTPLSKEDLLGNALIQMRNNLKKLSEVNAGNSWLQTSIVETGNVLRGEKSAEDFAGELLSKLAQILKFQAGALYLVQGDVLKLTGTYAFSHRKSPITEFKLGEGLVGQAALEKKVIIFDNVPAEFIYIQSGLAEGEAPQVILQPFLFHGNVIGVMELASTRHWTDLQCTFLDQVEESIAIAFHSIQARQEMKRLLVATQEMAEELRVQQEELREANEELEQQAKALKESEASLQAQQEELRVTNEELEEKTRILEQQKAAIALKNQELENAKAEIERKAREVEKASQYKSEFLANMSHELRTPLNSLLILSKSLMDNKKGNLTPDQVEAAQIIYNSGNELLTLINDILDLSKIEAGRLDINPEKVETESLASYVKMHFNHIASQKGLEFRVLVADDVPEQFVTDRLRLEQILKNLLSNAIKFTSQGSVTFEISMAGPNHKFVIPALQKGPVIAFSVTDTGIGIPKDKQDLIFEAFKQADGSTSRKYGGTGLGLSISKELARLLGGEIQLESEPGKGSRFTIYLPLKMPEKEIVNPTPEPIPQTTTPAPPSKPVDEDPLLAETPPEPPKVDSIPDDRNLITSADRVLLIVEDDASFASVLAAQAREKGFKVLASATGEEGLELANRFKPAAIILDINLPGMNGWDVLDRLKETPSLRHIPVHIMSAYDEDLEAYRKGAIGYLTKPVNPDQLDSAFERIGHYISGGLRELLLVEDDKNLRKSIKTIIGEKDIKITECDSGKAALEAIRSKHFDCMVLDLGLPDMSGFELLRAIKNTPEFKAPPVIVYTGRELTREEDKELHQYTDSIIIKGVKSEERLLDETALFLHRVVSEMPPQQQEIISFLHDRDTIFRNKKILIVDDDMRNVIALTRVLEEKEIIVRAAENGQMAIDMLNQEPDIHLVLMDIMMPVMDGYDTIRKIREIPQFRNLPIIALTAKAMKEDRNRCIAAGASDYISKPVNVDKLLSLIRVWLHK